MTVASESESRINLNYIARASAEPINLELSKNAGTQRENSNYGVLRVYLLQRARAHYCDRQSSAPALVRFEDYTVRV